MRNINLSSHSFTSEWVRGIVTSPLFYLYRPALIVLIALNTAVVATTAMLVSYFDSQWKWVNNISRFWGKLNLMLSGVSISVSGHEFIDEKQPYIVMANHQSHYDVLALIGYLSLPLKWVMKMELRKIPVFGIACEKIGHIYIDRGNSEKARKSLDAASEKIRTGSSVIFFPEGTRSLDGKFQSLKKGGFILALEVKVPILPITVVGGGKILPKRSLRILPGNMKIIIHEPIPTNEYTYETKEKLIEQVRRVIEKDLE